MMSTRREFLSSSALLLAAGSLSPATALAAPPPQRTGKPYFKLSLAAYSFNRQLARNPAEPEAGRMTLFDFIDYCAELDLAGTELTAYYFPAAITEEYLLQVKERCFRLGLDISGTAIGNDFCLPPGEARDRQLAMTRAWIDHAAVLGAPVIRIFAGNVPKGETEAAALDRCVEGINASLAYAATKGVVLALENHGGITATSEQLLKIIERIEPSPWFGVNFDSGNFRTENPYEDLERIAPYAVNAQLKVTMHPAGSAKEPTDYARVIQILKAAGYRGYLVLEYEEPEDPRTEIPKHIDRLRELIG